MLLTVISCHKDHSINVEHSSFSCLRRLMLHLSAQFASRPAPFHAHVLSYRYWTTSQGKCFPMAHFVVNVLSCHLARTPFFLVVQSLFPWHILCHVPLKFSLAQVSHSRKDYVWVSKVDTFSSHRFNSAIFEFLRVNVILHDKIHLTCQDLFASCH